MLQQPAARAERESEAILRVASTVTSHSRIHCVSRPRRRRAAGRKLRSSPRHKTAADTANALLIREGQRAIGAPVPPDAENVTADYGERLPDLAQ